MAIVEEKEGLMEFDIETLKAFLPKKEVLYTILKRASYNFALPSFKSSGVTVEYLFRVAERRVFTIEKTKYRTAPKVLKKNITIDELKTELEKITDKELGFVVCKYPDREWLLNSIYSLKPDHSIFSIKDITFQRRVPME